jgi:L-lactate dehydrogenase complex protein LldE
MKVALFVTCLIDGFRPSAADATLKLLEDAGCEVAVPLTQTCCGQPAHNGGDAENARAIARQVIETFAAYEHVVIPSGSCAGMLIKHYPTLFSDDPAWQQRAQAFAGRCHELVNFLHDVLALRDFPARAHACVTYHDSCSSLRETGSAHKARALLRSVPATELRELPDAEVCCGFGGAFALKYGDIAARIVDDKIANIGATGAPLLLAADLGCLLHIAGRCTRTGQPLRAFHIAEFLAGMTDGPAIGEGAGGKPAS